MGCGEPHNMFHYPIANIAIFLHSNMESHKNQQYKIIMLVIYKALSYLQYLHCG